MTIGYGTAALGRSMSRRARVRLVEAAYDAGIRYFDTAPLYGGGAAEDALGRGLHGKDDVTVVTKVGIVAPGVVGLALRRPARAHQFAPEEIRTQLEDSLRRLRIDQADGVLLHEVGPAEAAGALDELHRAGIVREVGLATGAAATRVILRDLPVDVVQLHAADAFEPGGARLVLHSVLAGRIGAPSAVDLLRACAAAHPDAVLLVGSRNEAHVREAAAALA